MLKANHNRTARILFNIYTRNLLKRHFGDFILTNSVPELNNSKGLIITPNHFSWWDGFFIDYLTRKLTNRKIHVMMLEEQLRRYWFFRFVGAYSINHGSPKSTAESLSYTTYIVDNSKNLAVIYPQGKIEKFSKYPFKLKSGIVKILKNSQGSTNILPVAFKIFYSERKKPDVLIRFGSMIKQDLIIDDFSNFCGEFNLNIKLLDEFDINTPFKILN